MAEFLSRLSTQLEHISVKRTEQGFPIEILTEVHCIENSRKQNLENQLIVTKPDYLAPEYHTTAHQLNIVINENNCYLLCKNTFTGEYKYFEYSEVIGIADMKKLPQWVTEKLKKELNNEER